MAKLYISFLGTSNYVPCCYQIDDVKSAPVRFIQEQTVRHCCRDWAADDRIAIFCTRAAGEKNWRDNGQKDGQHGLASRLASLDLKAPFKSVDIPDGHTEAQIWEIFAIVLEHISQGDEVVFDITHAFRSIPMLAIIILNYAKVVFKIKLMGIYYGAFEALGNPREVAARWPDPEDRVAPVLNLTALDRLLDWSFAVDKLMKAGDATAVCALARASVKDLLKESNGKDSAALAIRRLGDILEQFTLTLSTCRCREIDASVGKLKTALDDCSRADLINPLKPLIADMKSSVAPFRGDAVTDGIQAARWCARHHLVQQGITILNETLITWCLMAAGKEKNIHDVEMRTIASQAMDIVNRDRLETEWKGDAKNRPELTKQIIHAISQGPGVEKKASSLRELRNDINHGGMRKGSRNSRDFSIKLKKLLEEVDDMLTD